jgi:hypothetical protein
LLDCFLDEAVPKITCRDASLISPYSHAKAFEPFFQLMDKILVLARIADKNLFAHPHRSPDRRAK